jgi:hypothetical protein
LISPHFQVKRDKFTYCTKIVVARHKISAASAGDFIVVRFALIGSLGVAT